MFDEIDNGWTGPPVTHEIIEVAERRLGYFLPPSYRDVLRERNGGVLNNKCIQTKQQTFYGGRGLSMFGILGIGGVYSVDSSSPIADSRLGNHNCLGRAKLHSWKVTDEGFAFSWFGHAGYFFIFSLPYLGSEPSVYYVDAELPEPRIMEVASSFSELLTLLTPELPGDST